MKRKVSILCVLSAGLLALPSFAGDMGCCGSDSSAMANCPGMSAAQSPSAQPSASAQQPESVTTVFEKYSRIELSLAQDSVKNVSADAQAISAAVKGDAANPVPASVAQQSEALAKASDLPTARESFKQLSQSLIDFAAKNPQFAGSYRQVHCPMANADWLQTGTVVINPYLGKSMVHCGEFVKAAQAPSSNHSMRMD